MPTYTFLCKNNHRFEQMQRMNYEGDRRTAVCPECGKKAPSVPSWEGGFKMFKEGVDVCTGVYHPTEKHYNNYIKEKGLVKLD
jgi:putative FmdB family regulatory protein